MPQDEVEAMERDLRIKVWNVLRDQGVMQERCYPIINATVEAAMPLLARKGSAQEQGTHTPEDEAEHYKRCA